MVLALAASDAAGSVESDVSEGGPTSVEACPPPSPAQICSMCGPLEVLSGSMPQWHWFLKSVKCMF